MNTFCKFKHNASIQVVGDMLRIYYDDGEQDTFTSSAGAVFIALAYIDEGLVHALSADGYVFQIDGRDGMQIRKLGASL